VIRRLRGRISADLIVVLAFFVALVAFSAYTTARRLEEQGAPAYSTYSTAPDGAAALYLWLGELGYRVERIEGGPFRVSDDAGLLFVLAPAERYSGLEARQVQDWVEEPGRTLVVAIDGSQAESLALQFGFDSQVTIEPAEILTPVVPLLVHPPPGPVQARSYQVLSGEEDGFVAHLQNGEAPVLVSLRQGAGRVILTTAIRPLTNEGLHDPGSARLVYNLLSGLQPGALIQFDEVHHGYAPQQQDDSLLAWLYRSPWGWALLYGGVVTLAWIALRGRRFGQPVPLPERTVRRPQSEYVVSMAQLFRRGGRRAFVLRHHHDHLKRELARPWRLNPDLPDDLFVADLARCRDDLDATALQGLLARLAAGRAKEGELVRLVAEVEAWLKGERR
jgi:hypothetical protein